MQGKIVEVSWFDAYSPDLPGEGYWGSREELEDHKAELCYTVGYLISQKNGWLTLAQSKSNFSGEQTVGGSFRIPSKWIHKIKEK
jgi:hypothetical protein